MTSGLEEILGSNADKNLPLLQMVKVRTRGTLWLSGLTMIDSMPDVRLFSPQVDEGLRTDISDLWNTSVFSSTYLVGLLKLSCDYVAYPHPQLLEIISTLEDEVWDCKPSL